MREVFTIDPVSRVFHWVIGIAMIGMIPFGLYLENVPEETGKLDLLLIHTGIGLTVLVLAAIRFRRRISQGFPATVPTHKTWERALARPIHWILLIATVFAPITGILFAIGKGYPISWFGLITLYDGEPVPGLEAVIHILHGPVLVLGVGLATLLHIVGAVKHHIVDRDRTLKRMIVGE